MQKVQFSSESIKILRKYALIISLCWSLMILGMALFNYLDSYHYAKLNLIEQARDTFNKDLVLRRWVASHGGVYVPVDQKTPPNPFLSHLPHRDLVTTDGHNLTLMNPAYVMRQVHEMSLAQFGFRGHITSLRPLRPENAADEWETRALKKMAQGIPEVVEKNIITGRPYIRLMRPLFVEKPCLKCHAIQGYKVGDLRGGTSVAVPMTAALANHQAHMRKVIAALLGLWLAGLLLIYRVYRHNHERIRKNAELHLYMHRLSTMVEQTHSAIMIVGVDGRIEFVNHGYELLSGYKAAEMLGRNPRELFSAGKLQEQRELLWQTVSQGQLWRGVLASRHKDGSLIYEDVSAFPILDDSGEIINYAVIKYDVTAAHELQDQLLQAQKMEAVGTLASGVAHDFNNILTVINSFSEILIDECEADSPIRVDLEEINKAGLRAAELTRQLLAFSRRQIIQPRPICLRKLIENLMKMMHRLLSEEIELEFILPENTVPVQVLADPGQVEQVLINLLVNARDALQDVDRSKKIIVHLDSVELGSDFVATHIGSRPGAFALIEVKDNGCGMDQEALRHCFEPFYTTKELGQGTGLGLSMIYGIVKQNDGYVCIISEPDLGTAIQIYWPLAILTDDPGVQPETMPE